MSLRLGPILPNPISNLVSALKEAVTPHRTVAFLSESEKALGVSPEVSFKTMTAVYKGDLGARASVDLLGDKVATRFYTTMNEKYMELSDSKTAKELVDDWCALVNVDQVLQQSARFLIGWGNLFWWVGNPVKVEFLKVMPLEIIQDQGVKFNDSGAVAKILLDWDRLPKEISGTELILLSYNVMTANSLGFGLLEGLCTPLNIGDTKREAFYKIKGKLHQGMADTIYTFGAPNELYSLPGMKDKAAKDLQAELKSTPRRGRRIVINPPAGSEAKVQSIVAERMRGLDYYAETLDDEYNLGLQTPLNRLISKRGFTEASSKTAESVSEDRVFALQQFLKRGVERFLFDRVVAAAGLDPEQAQVRLNWGVPETLDYEKLTAMLGQLAELLKVNPSVISTVELRKILRDVAKLPLEEESAVPSSVVQVEKQLANRAAGGP